MVETSNPTGTANAWRMALLALFVCVCLNPGTQAAQTVQSLRYGSTLFHFFQQDYYSALTDLMVAQKLDQLGPHTERAEMLRGGMNLSYGMDNEARLTFETLLGENSDLQYLDDRDRAWFYLAKLAWRRGDAGASKYALEKLSRPYREPFAEEAIYLHSSLALREGDEKQALDYARQLTENSPWKHYLYYNLGANQAAGESWQAAIEYFSQLDQMPLITEESKTVRDRALTASGYALMSWGKFGAAREQFKQVRLDSPMADRALLGYGWASSEMGDFPLALSSWQTLSGRGLYAPAARESLLAIPYAYEELGRSGIALENYRLASDVYRSQLSEIREAIENFRDGDLVELLDLGVARPNSDTDAHGWIFGESLLPYGQHSNYLGHLLTRHNFQLAMRELKDLYRLAWHLDDADQRLQVLDQVAEDQQASWSTVIEGDRRDRLQRKHQQLQQRIDLLNKKLRETGDDAGGWRLLADSQQSALWRRLDVASDLAKHLSGHASLVGEIERLSLYRGLMLWQDSEQFSARSWQLEQEKGELESLILQSATMLERVDEAIARHSEFEFSQRISTMGTRIESHRERVADVISKSELQLRALAVSELGLQEDQVSRALGQTRLAIARLFDGSSPGAPR